MVSSGGGEEWGAVDIHDEREKKQKAKEVRRKGGGGECVPHTHTHSCHRLKSSDEDGVVTCTYISSCVGHLFTLVPGSEVLVLVRCSYVSAWQ